MEQARTGYLLHATDADDDPSTWSKLTVPTFGIVSINPATGVVSYNPLPNYYGPDAFIIQVADGLGGTDTITVNVTVTLWMIRPWKPTLSG